ncbi:MAG TPA: CHAT domain-containing protein, partial [Pyrinomonadaceae bacterium]|nr:CHAT domain-containing protein [Pyrinomonadaceae bacterium]
DATCSWRNLALTNYTGGSNIILTCGNFPKQNRVSAKPNFSRVMRGGSTRGINRSGINYGESPSGIPVGGYEMPEGGHQVHSEIRPEVIVELAPGGPRESAPEMRPEVLPEVRPEVMAEHAPTVRPEVAAESAPVRRTRGAKRKPPATQPTVEKAEPEKAEAAKAEAQDTRQINVEIEGKGRDEPLRVNTLYTLTLDIDTKLRETSIVQDEQATNFKLSYEEGEEDVELTVNLSSEDFKIYVGTETLIVPRQGRSKNKADFGIKPLHDGPSKLRALILKNNNFVQELTMTLEVGSVQTTPVTAVSSGRPLEAAAIVKPRDVHLSISESSAGGFDLKLFYGVTSEARIPLTPQAVDEMSRNVRDVLEKIINRQEGGKPVYQVGVDIPENVKQESLEKLAEAGYKLYDEIFYKTQENQAKKMGDLLSTIARREKMKIQISADRFYLPWGVLYLADKPSPVDPEMFLGLKHITEHIPKQESLTYLTLQMDGNPKFSVSLNLDKDIDNEAAKKGFNVEVVGEQIKFWDKLKTAGKFDVAVREKSEDLLNAVRNNELTERLIYFYCHAAAKTAQDAPYLKLGGGTKLKSSDLTNAGGRSFSLTSAPLVFINACESGEMSPFFYDDFLSYFVSRGARGVIGTECKIPAVFASEWARRFFARFLPGKSLGELFLELRREFFFDHKNLLGLAYALYCDGDTQINPGLDIG